MEDLMIKIENISKKYKLGEIGGTTLRDELQRLSAKIRKKEDPTKKIGAKNYNKGETFMALNGISFEVRKGERVGIIGHNGAGKSTLLKLISRVTAPTDGIIKLNGRVASMLEVGTGFHPELTGRENIYMNGAILGMTKKEIDAKIEDIIEFSEVREFIDTPVKRYSSGMYVKLAFSVAAHLDSEIMIMDEVLAVGDVSFQKKCIDKMNQVSKDNGRTILYVSHNMNTIRELCNRVVVLDHGKVIYDGMVEEGIGTYLGLKDNLEVEYDYKNYPRKPYDTKEVILSSMKILNKNVATFNKNDKMNLAFDFFANSDCKNVGARFIVFSLDGVLVGTSFGYNLFDCKKGDKLQVKMDFDLSGLAPNKYYVDIVLFGKNIAMDTIEHAISFEVLREEDPNRIHWFNSRWGNVEFKDIEVKEIKRS